MSIYTSTSMKKPKRGEKCPTCGRKLPKRIPVQRANPRKGPMRDPGYRRWLRIERFCYIAGAVIGGQCEPFPFNPDPAHTQNNGMGSKGPDSSCVPLCRRHHSEYDRDRKAFERKYGICMAEIAKEHYARYLKEQEEQNGTNQNI